ncbi:AzlC family ABC transporter permease [Actinotignum urinale]|uniref:AzlC family ABC transporter permease n=1 Tax=Actinotignum urinale TaxID=190146 RepID=UPI0011AFA982|nr:AzlC family ABC transporter permease [Actinotignum urinale]WIK59119.1 AzlC family ABC transporter permease [Actinotignum urinale]
MKSFRSAFEDTSPIIVGYLPLAVTFGLFAVSQGFHWWWAVLTAMCVYSGALEFILVALYTGGASLATVATASFFVSFRHFFYGLSVPISPVKPLARLYVIHALTDETYALLSSPAAKTFTGARIFWCQLLCHSTWVAGVAVGALAGTYISGDLTWLAFTLTALFVCMSIDALKASSQPWLLGAIALACSLIFLWLAPEYTMIGSLLTYACISLIVGKTE